VKLEIDTKPPGGARTETRVLSKFFLMALRHHDLPCLMAGKIRALLTRPYAKGRDWYDLLWYRTRVPPVDPFVPFLQASLDQGASDKPVDAAKWKSLLTRKAREADWKSLADDAAQFLERPQEKNMLTRDFLLRAIRGR
jgi:hypothetical protein